MLYGRHFELVGLVTNQLRTYVAEGDFFFNFPILNMSVNRKFSILNTAKLFKLFFELEI